MHPLSALAVIVVGVTTALYRRYRPDAFADMIGQDQVTGPLMQALRTGRVGHAYLFSGPRGCGKTTSARVLARSLNCAQGPTAEPCGTCESCVALARGGSGSVDVIEIDAASHGGVDDARDLRERASYGPAQSRYKIYIIDEAHMVTPQGFNALLKIVEEPPEHVKFIFATTEPEKVIGTIRSRTHHYPFRLVPPGTMQDYLERLCEAEGVRVEPGVLSFVVRAGGGSFRDALSVLDQLIAGSGDDGLTYAGAVGLLGFTDGELLDAVVDAFAAHDAAAVFRQIDKVIESGHDPRRFIEDLLERLRDLIVVAAVPEGAAQVLRAVPEDQIERMRQQAAGYGAGALSRAADIANTGLTEMTGATAPRLQLELIAARILLPASSGEGGYAARLDRLERRLDLGGDVSSGPRSAERGGGDDVSPAPRSAERGGGDAATPPGSAPAEPAAPADSAPSDAWPEDEPPAAAPPEPEPEPEGPPPEPAPAAQPGAIDTDAVRRAWPDVLDKIFGLKRVTWALLSQHAQVVDYDGRRLLLGTSTQALADTFRRGQHPDIVRQAVLDAIGVDCQVEAVPHDGPPPPTPSAAPAVASEGPDESAERPAPTQRSDRPREQQPPPRAPRPPSSNAVTEIGGAAPPGGWDADTRDSWGSPAGPPPDWASTDSEPSEAATPETSAGARPAVTDVSAKPEPADAEPVESASAAPEMAAQSPRRRAEERARRSTSRADERTAAPAADDGAVDFDDESVENSDSVGLPVIQSVLGGTVIAEEGER